MLLKILLGAVFCITSFLSASLDDYLSQAKNKSTCSSIPGIDYVYVINLERRPDRWEKVKTELARFNITPYRFSAVNGWELNDKAFNALGISYQPGTPPGPLCTVFRQKKGEVFLSFEIMQEEGVSYFCHGVSKGAVGIILSHLSCLQDALNAGYETIWVMEDDIKIVQDPQILLSIMTDLDCLAPDWDILFTDCETKGGDGKQVPCLDIRPRPNFPLQPVEYYRQRYLVTQQIEKIGMRFGAYSMIIRRSGMEKILNFFKTYQLYFPYDIDYFIVPDIQLYQCTYDIVTTIPGFQSNDSDNAQPSYLNTRF